jgi:hypothetical protein
VTAVPNSLTVLEVDPHAVGAGLTTLELLRGPGAVVWRGAVCFDERAARWVSDVESAYQKLEPLVAQHGTFGVAALLPAGTRWQPTAASLGLEAVASPELVLQALPACLPELAHALVEGEAALDVDLCWIRRQYPEATRPKGQAAHAFHQDGAYGFDFSAQPDGAAIVPPMLTAWIPLGPAGRDAPGLELIPRSPHRLLGPEELREASIDAEWSSEERVYPVLEPGDVVLMAGHHLHRTHVVGAMSKARTCVELRFVRRAGAPPALAAHRLLPLGG